MQICSRFLFSHLRYAMNCFCTMSFIYNMLFFILYIYIFLNFKILMYIYLQTMKQIKLPLKKCSLSSFNTIINDVISPSTIIRSYTISQIKVQMNTVWTIWVQCRILVRNGIAFPPCFSQYFISTQTAANICMDKCVVF